MSMYLYEVNKDSVIWASDRQNAIDIYSDLFESAYEVERIDGGDMISFVINEDADTVIWYLEDGDKYMRKLTVKKFRDRILNEIGKV